MKNNLEITIIELEEHADGIDGHCQWLSDTGCKVNVLTTENNIQFLPTNNYRGDFSFIAKSKYESNKTFLKHQETLLNNSDVVFINTINVRHRDYTEIKSNKGIIILRVHNAHKQFAPFSHINFPTTPYLVWKFTSYVFRELILTRFNYYRKKINKQTDYFTFLLDSIKEYVTKQKLVEKEKVGYALPQRPVTFTSFEYKPELTGPLNITIVGTLSERTKDLQPIVDALTILFNKNANIKINLTLLGDANTIYGKKVVSQFKNIKTASFSINYFMKKVDTETFNDCLTKTDLLISPIKVKCITDIYIEIYGKTKFTGILGDLALFPIPVIFPAEFDIESALKSNVWNYSSASSLAELLINISANKSQLIDKQKNIEQYFKIKYDSKKIKTEYLDFLQSAYKKKNNN